MATRTLHARLSGSFVPSSRLRYLNKAVRSQLNKKYNWQRTSAELTIWTGARALLDDRRDETHCKTLNFGGKGESLSRLPWISLCYYT